MTANLRGISAVSDAVVWASGENGTIVRTLDGGEHWEKVLWRNILLIHSRNLRNAPLAVSVNELISE